MLIAAAAQPFDWIEHGTPEAQAVLSEHGLADAELPVVIAGEKRVEAATVERVAEAWHVSDPPRRSCTGGWTGSKGCARARWLGRGRPRPRRTGPRSG